MGKISSGGIWYRQPLFIGTFYVILLLLFCFCLSSAIFMFMDRGGSNSTKSILRFQTANKTSTVNSSIRGTSLSSPSVGTSNSGSVTVRADLLPIETGVVGTSNGPGDNRPWLIGSVGEPVAAGSMVKLQNNGYLYSVNSPFVYNLDSFQSVNRITYDGGSYSDTSNASMIYDSNTSMIFQISPQRRDGKSDGYNIIRFRANSSTPQAVYVDDSQPASNFLASNSSWVIMATQKASITSNDLMNIVALATPTPFGQHAGQVTIIGGYYFFRTSVETTLPDGSQQTVIGVHPDATTNLFIGYQSLKITYSSTYPITAAHILPTSDPYLFVLITVEDQVYIDWIQLDPDGESIITKSSHKHVSRVSLGPAATGVTSARTLCVIQLDTNKAEVMFTRNQSLFSVTVVCNPGDQTVTLLRPQILTSSIPATDNAATAVAATAFVNDQWIIALTHVNTQRLYLISLQYNSSSGRKTNISALQLVANNVRAGILAMTTDSSKQYQWLIYASSNSNNVNIRKINFGQSFLGIGNEQSLDLGSSISNTLLPILYPDAKSADGLRFMFVTPTRLITLHDSLPTTVTDMVGIVQQTTNVYTDTVSVATVGQISTIHSNLSIGSAVYWDDSTSAITTTSNNRGRIGIALSSNELLLTRLF